MVLSTIHVSQAHIFEKQSRCRESSSSVSTVVPVPGFFFSAGYDENPFIRANCFLAETGKPTVMLNKRYGEKEELEPLTAGMAEKLLEEAYAQAHEKAGITWEGQEFLVEGNPAVLANASAEDDEKGN